MRVERLAVRLAAGWALGFVVAATLSVPISASARETAQDVTLQSCVRNARTEGLTLTEFVTQVLCRDPRSAATWARVEMQSAALGLSKASYYPNVNISAGFGRVDETAKYKDAPDQNGSLRGQTNDQAISLTWILYDFGLRSAQMSRERAQLEAALASQDDIVQIVLSEAVTAYFEALQTDRTLTAQRDTETVASKSLRVVEDKLTAGVATEADRLQAKTALARALVDRVSAEGESLRAHGMLAVMMGLQPDVDISVQETEDDSVDAPQVGDLAGHLLDRSVQSHPRVAAALAELQAARSNVEVAKSSGLPRVSLSALGERSDNPADRALIEQTVRMSSIGLQLSVPIFDGFTRKYQVKQAEATLDQKTADLRAAEQDVTREIWRRYVAVKSGVADLRASQGLLDTASQSYELASGRYQTGVGTIVEMLLAQSDLAAAREHHEAAATQLRSARLLLAVSIGQFGISQLGGAANDASNSHVTGDPVPAIDVEPMLAPRINAIDPHPVPGGQGPRALTLSGEHFAEGAVVNLRNKSDGQNYPGRVPVVFGRNDLWVWAPIGCAADWSAQVDNPDGQRSDEFTFKVVGGC